MILCAGQTELFDFATPIGVGLIETAYNLPIILAEKKPKTLLFVGSCGSYGKLGILDNFYSSSAAQIECSSVFARSYTPLESKIQNNVSHETIVNSSNYITSDEEASKKFLELGLGAENMEFYSVLWVAKKLGIKAKGFFVVTNNCFCDAKTEYIKNLSTAKDIIYDRYIKELKEYE